MSDLNCIAGIKGISIWVEYYTTELRAPLQVRNFPLKRALNSNEQIFQVSECDISAELSIIENNENFNEIDILARLEISGTKKIRRASFIFHLANPSRGLIDRNGRHFVPYREKYWIGKNGCVEISTEKSASVLFSVFGFSSIELNGHGQQVWFNLINEQDHLLCRDSQFSIVDDVSYLREEKGIVLTGNLRLLKDTYIYNVPAILPHLDGALGTLIITEHACFTALETHNSFYFGSSPIKSSEKRGVVSKRIPVSKSVFLSNKDAITNSSQSSLFPGRMCSLEDPAFESFVSETYNLGIAEVGLHCIDPNRSDIAEVQIALETINKKYKARFWIDHIWFKPGKLTTGSNEGFFKQLSSDKTFLDSFPNLFLDPSNNWFYIWSPASDYLDSYNCVQHRLSGCFGDRFKIDDEPIKNSDVFDSCDSREPGVSRPLCYNHPNIDKRIVFFPAKGNFNLSDDWDPINIADLISRGGTLISHCYPTYAGKNGNWVETELGIEISPKLEENLEFIKNKMNSGELSVTFLSKFLDHQKSIEELSWRKSNNGQIYIHNPNRKKIKVTISAQSNPDFIKEDSKISAWGTKVSTLEV